MLLYVLCMCDRNKTNQSSIQYVVVCIGTMRIMQQFLSDLDAGPGACVRGAGEE